jgi:hypothetical protein
MKMGAREFRLRFESAAPSSNAPWSQDGGTWLEDQVQVSVLSGDQALELSAGSGEWAAAGVGNDDATTARRRAAADGRTILRVPIIGNAPAAPAGSC